LDATATVFDCDFSVAAQSSSLKSLNLETARRYVNATYSVGGKVTNKFVVFYAKNADRQTSKLADEFEVKLESPDLTSGVTASRSVTGDAETRVAVSVFGLNERADLTFEQGPILQNSFLPSETHIPSIFYSRCRSRKN